MNNRDEIYIVGHKNPDTDSICAAIVYADIKTRSGQEGTYVPRRAGEIGPETEYVLRRFQVEPPALLERVGTQVKDMYIQSIPAVTRETSLMSVREILQENNLTAVPIVDEEGRLEGILSIYSVLRSLARTGDNRRLAMASTSFQKIAETIFARILTGDEKGVLREGRMHIITGEADVLSQRVARNDLVIMGNQREKLLAAIEKGVRIIVVELSRPIPEDILALARKKGIVIMSTPLDSFHISNLINMSLPIGSIMKTEGLVTFFEEDFTDDIEPVMLKKPHPSFPVINQEGRCVGIISRQNLLDMHRKKVILVDHNELGQAVDGMKQAQILEVIDHHKLGALETVYPISFHNVPVGCTCTIMYQIYRDQKLEITPQMAGLLCAAIISDTLLFRSPTCTAFDRMAAESLAGAAGVDLEELAKEMFRAGSNLTGKSIEQVFYQDYKTFVGAGDRTFGVGQISAMEETLFEELIPSLLCRMQEECEKTDTDMVFFMLTNILEESTFLLYCGEDSETLGRCAFRKEPEGDGFLLPGVVSRKKQLVPSLLKGLLRMEV